MSDFPSFCLPLRPSFLYGLSVLSLLAFSYLELLFVSRFTNYNWPKRVLPDKQISLLKLNKSLCFSCCWGSSICQAGWDPSRINPRQHRKTSNKSAKCWRRTCEEKSWTRLTAEKSAENLSGKISIHRTIITSPMKTSSKMLCNSVI